MTLQSVLYGGCATSYVADPVAWSEATTGSVVYGSTPHPIADRIAGAYGIDIRGFDPHSELASEKDMPKTIVFRQTDFASSKATSFPDGTTCETCPLDEWLRQLTVPGAAFFQARAQFVGDVGYALMLQRQAAGLSRKEHAKLAGISHVTSLEIESGQHPKGDGSSLGSIVSYLRPLDGSLTVMLNSNCNERALPDTRVLKFSDSAADFAAKLVYELRTHAGLSQAELGTRAKLPRKVRAGKVDASSKIAHLSTSPMISRIEAGKQRRGIRTSTLFTIAYICGFTLTVKLPMSAAK